MEPCTKEKEFGEIFTTLNFIKSAVEDIKNNHIHEIYGVLDTIKEKMNNRRPTYTTMWIITVLSSLCVGLLVAYFKH